MATKTLALINSELSAGPTSGSAIDIEIRCVDHRLRVSCGAGGRLCLTIPAADGDTTPRGCLELSSMSAARRAASGGKPAALSLLARGDLKLQGDCLEQIQNIQETLGALDASAVQRLRSLGEALISQQLAAAPWMPDREATRCMSPSCGKPFTMTRRRHHCRRCGHIFCSRCAPRPASGRNERTCTRCASTGRPPLSTDDLDDEDGDGDVEDAPPANAANTAAPAAAAASWLLELHVESELSYIAWRGRVVELALLGAAALALHSEERWRSQQVQAAFVGAATLGWLLRRWLSRYKAVAHACVVIALGLVATHLRSRGRSAAAQRALWELRHRVNARFVFETVARLGGFWVKLAQGASVVSALPDAYGAELSRLQDAMPADPMSAVHAVLKEELGANWRSIVVDIDPAPLGSATIAQVHKAKLRVCADDDEYDDDDDVGGGGGGGGYHGGRSGGGGGAVREVEVEGVLKVQHPHVAQQLDIDISASTAVAMLLSAVAPHLFRDLGPIVRDLAAITRAELDFRQEARSQTAARRSLAASGLRVRVPRVYGGLVTRRLLGMEFVNGVKVTEMKGKAGKGKGKGGGGGGHAEGGGGGGGHAEVCRVVETLVRYYGATMHGDVFNCDPHPGNLLVEERSGTLVVLDWGQARRLTPGERVGHAQLFLAVLMEDVNLLGDAVEALGAPFADLAAAPNATPATMIGALRFLLRDTKDSKFAARADFGQLERALGGLSGELKSIQGGGSDLFKGPMMPFSKTVGLLWEMSTLLGVSLPLLHSLASEGYAVLLRERGYGHVKLRSAPDLPSGFVLDPPPPPPPPLPLSPPQPSPLSPSSLPPPSLASSLSSLLAALHGEGLLLGASLSVIDAASGAHLADAVVGHCAWDAPAPVSASTRFNLAEISKLFLAFAVLRLVDRSDDGGVPSPSSPRLALSDALTAAGVTLEQALAHTAGHLQLLHPSVASFEQMCDVDGMAQLAASATPLLPPGARQQYHHTSYGWLLAHACRRAGTDVETAWEALAEAALGHDGARRLSLRAAGEGGAGQRAAGDGGGGGVAAAAGAEASNSKPMTSPRIDTVLEQLLFLSHVASRAARDGATDAEKADAAVWMCLFGKPQWVEPSAFSRPRARRAVLPGLQAYATARDAAAALRAVAFGGLLSPKTLAEARRSRRPPPSRLSTPTRMPPGFRASFGEEAEWGLGVQLVPCGGADCWGHLGANGSFALVIPGRRPLVATLLTNRAGSSEAAERVLKFLVEAAG